MAKMKVNRCKKLVIDFRYKGKRHVYSTGLSDTKDNRRKANNKLKAIEYGISANNLDLAHYFPQITKPLDYGSIATYFDYYIKEKTVRHTTLRSILCSWKYHIQPCFGQWGLKAVKPHDIKVFRNMLINEKKLKHSTINLIMTQFAGILKSAYNEGYISKTPYIGMGRLKEDKSKLNPFTFDELAHLMNTLVKKKPEYYDMIFIWVRCGFRIGEMLALKWKNLDYFNKTLYVESTLHANASEGLPKNEYSQRHVPLRTEVIDAFKRQAKRARMACEYIFPDPYTNARYATPALFYKRFIFLLALAGLKPRSPNQLRHTFATLHIASGENITWVSRMLGHSNTKITLDKYNQYVPNLLHEDGSAFEKAVQKPSLERQNSDTMATPPE